MRRSAVLMLLKRNSKRPVRVSALRALGGYMNVFTIESFMDELAAAAGADPVEFRLRHLDDPRARDVVTTAAERFGWSSYPRAAGRGRGFAFAKYKNLAAYCAVAAEADCGLLIENEIAIADEPLLRDVEILSG